MRRGGRRSPGPNVLFYAEGIHPAVKAKLTRATFCRHFPGKEDLILAYLRKAHEMERDLVDTAVAGSPSPAEWPLAVGRSIARTIQSPGFRGCAFLNAAAEYPDKNHPFGHRLPPMCLPARPATGRACSARSGL
ncbi:TetR/AcrR family transcriptional regulator [Micromonospora chalcea]